MSVLFFVGAPRGRRLGWMCVESGDHDDKVDGLVQFLMHLRC